MADDGDVFAVPVIDDHLIASCRASRNAMPIVFIWSCYAVRVTRPIAALQLPLELGNEARAQRHHLALAGLVLRASNLLHAMLELAKEQDHGEAFRVLARSASEASIKLRWLLSGDDERLNRFLAEGLKAELELRSITTANIESRGWPLPIEVQFLESIEKVLRLCGLSQDEIETAKKLPDMARMYDEVGLGRHLYVTTHKLGSQATHATWLDIVVSYLGFSREGEIGMNFGPVLPNSEILRETALTVLDAAHAVVEQFHRSESAFLSAIETAESGLLETVSISSPEDASIVAKARALNHS